jgi:hypothetical protein
MMISVFCVLCLVKMQIKGVTSSLGGKRFILSDVSLVGKRFVILRQILLFLF